MTRHKTIPNKVMIIKDGRISQWHFQVGQVYEPATSGGMSQDDLCCTAIQPKGGKTKDYRTRNSYRVQTEDGRVFIPHFMAKVVSYEEVEDEQREREYYTGFDDDDDDDDEDDDPIR